MIRRRRNLRRLGSGRACAICRRRARKRSLRSPVNGVAVGLRYLAGGSLRSQAGVDPASAENAAAATDRGHLVEDARLVVDADEECRGGRLAAVRQGTPTGEHLHQSNPKPRLRGAWRSDPLARCAWLRPSARARMRTFCRTDEKLTIVAFRSEGMPLPSGSPDWPQPGRRSVWTSVGRPG